MLIKLIATDECSNVYPSTGTGTVVPFANIVAPNPPSFVSTRSASISSSSSSKCAWSLRSREPVMETASPPPDSLLDLWTSIIRFIRESRATSWATASDTAAPISGVPDPLITDCSNIIVVIKCCWMPSTSCAKSASTPAACVLKVRISTLLLSRPKASARSAEAKFVACSSECSCKVVIGVMMPPPGAAFSVTPAPAKLSPDVLSVAFSSETTILKSS